MRKYGVVYAGKERQHQFAALAVTGGKGMAGDPPATIENWERLVAQVERVHRKRVIVSSEYFDEADDETARRVVTELGGPKVHVLVTLRPLAKILPSAWQQYVRNRLRVSYDDWVEAMLRRPPYDRPTPSFWKRHHHDVLVARWASVVGPENLTVVVVDETDVLSLLRLVERFVGLPDGLLQPEVGWTNRSLTYGEIELVRHLNTEFKARGWPGEAYKAYVRRGMVRHLQTVHKPGPDEEPIHTPDWALDQVAAIGAEAAKKIETLGVRIIGDISTLGSRPPSRHTTGSTTSHAPAPRDERAPGRDSSVPVLPSEVAAKAVVGAILATAATGGAAPATLAQTPPEAPPPPRRAVDGLRRRVRGVLARPATGAPPRGARSSRPVTR